MRTQKHINVEIFSAVNQETQETLSITSLDVFTAKHGKEYILDTMYDTHFVKILKDETGIYVCIYCVQKHTQRLTYNIYECII